MPSWANFDFLNGRLWGTPAYGDAGTYSGITITASDGDLSDSQTFSISVAIGNYPPTISGSPATRVNAGSSYSFTPIASDPDDDPLTFSITNKPSWASLILRQEHYRVYQVKRMQV